MISITREVARHVRAFLRKAGAGRNQRPVLELKASGGELHILAQLPDVTIDFKQPGPVELESFLLPFEALEDVEGKSTSNVTFIRTSEGVDASWEDGKIPKRKSYPVSDAAIPPTIPDVDRSKYVEVPGLLQALGHATQCGGDAHPRYATQKIQLRGARGEVIATDGRQALIQTGFSFPWTEDVLIPSLALFGSRELPVDLPVTVCLGKTHLALQVSNVTLYVASDREGRYPNVAQALPTISAGATTLRLSPQDADFLTGALAKLPGGRGEFAHMTVDLNGEVVLRAKDDDQGQTTEVLLAGSEYVGSPVRINTDRRFLARAVGLGFTDITIVAADKPIVCKDQTRTYVWVPLDKGGAIPPSDDAIRITTEISTEVKANIPQPLKERMSPPMPTPNSNGRNHVSGARDPNVPAASLGNGQDNGAAESVENPTATAGNGLGALIAEAHALRDFLHDGYARASRLCVSLKKHRKQSKLVASTLASLRQLQQIEG